MLGIFGGMGPEATVDLFRRIVEATPAQRDQDHLPTLVFSYPQVPERTPAIRSGDRAPVPYLVEGVRLLDRAGASLIAIPCNTAHFWYDDMQAAVGIPIVHMIREAAAVAAARLAGGRRVGLLATAGTLESGLYAKELERLGLECLVPDAAQQEAEVTASIADIKARRERARSRERLARAAAALESRGAELILLGCTEIPLAFDPATTPLAVVDATQVLAEASLRRFGALGAA
jgi:aspartate racemase